MLNERSSVGQTWPSFRLAQDRTEDDEIAVKVVFSYVDLL